MNASTTEETQSGCYGKYQIRTGGKKERKNENDKIKEKKREKHMSILTRGFTFWT